VETRYIDIDMVVIQTGKQKLKIVFVAKLGAMKIL